MRLRQLPELYLRGSMANETMANLKKEQQQTVETIIKKAVNSSLLSRHRQLFAAKLAKTVGGDYSTRENGAADQEYHVVIWRAAINLLYHCDYQFKCGHCSAVEYMTSRNSIKKFDMRYKHCPACLHVLITNPGDGPFKAGQYATLRSVQAHLDSAACENAPEYTTPIISQQLAKKIEDPTAVLSDDEQFVKYFGNFIWNYYYQILRENKIKHHSSDPYVAAGRADTIALEEFTSFLGKNNIRYNYIKSQLAEPTYIINVNLLGTNVKVSKQLKFLQSKYYDCDVIVELNDDTIVIHKNVAAKEIEAEISTPRPVLLQVGDNEDSGSESVDIYRDEIKGGNKMNDPATLVEFEDLCEAITTDLSETGVQVFDIMMQRGETWDKFTNHSGHKSETRPSAESIASFLQTTTKDVSMVMRDIRHKCMLHGVGS